MEKHNLEGFLRLDQIVRTPNASQTPLIPISVSSWWLGIRKGKYPAPIKLGSKTTVWRVRDIKNLLEKLSGTNDD